MEQQLSKYQALAKGKSPPMSALQLSVLNTMALPHRQPAARLPSEEITSTYGATSTRSSKFMSHVSHFDTSSQVFANIDSPGVYSSSGYTVPVSAKESSNMFSQADAVAIDPTLTAYSGTSYSVPQNRASTSHLTPAGQPRLLVKSDALPHFKLDVVAPELTQDSAAVLPDGWTDSGQRMVDPTSLQNEQPGYSNIMPDYDTAQYSPAEDQSFQPANQIPNFPSVCFLCPQTTGPIQAPIFNTVDDYNVHLWQKHSDLSNWTQRKCIWKGCTTKCAFATAKLCMFNTCCSFLFYEEPRFCERCCESCFRGNAIYLLQWASRLLDRYPKHILIPPTGFAHVRQVHQKNFYCTLPNCRYRLGGPSPKPFGSQNVPNRHRKSKMHATPVYCDKPHCISKQNVLRKDKMNKHDAEYHGRFICTSVGCPRSYIDGVYYGFASDEDLLSHQEAKHHMDMSNTAVGYGTTAT